MSSQPPWPATTALPAITIGTRLTDFASFDIIVEGLASGGMGLVVWGPNTADGGHMEAAKLLRPDLLASASSPEQRQQLQADFEHEALIWCHLWSHPYLIGATGLTRLPGWNAMPVLMLEYARLGSLRQWLVQAHQPGNRLRWQTALAWAQQIAAALVAIHTPDPDHERPNPLVHCDLKPENVLIMGNGWAQLTDLGLARALAHATIVPSATDSLSAAAPTQQVNASSAPDQPSQLQTISQMTTMILSGPPGSAGIASSPAQQPPTPAATQREQGTRAEREERIARMRAALIAAGALPTAAGVADRARRSQRIPALPTVAAIGSRGHVAGTPIYMAPEQWLGLDAAVPATDIYALGILLFELFAGVSYVLPHAEPPATLSRDAYLAAWYESHRRGAVRALSAPEVRTLNAGPLSALVEERGEQGRQLAAQTLAQLDRLIGSCLAPQAALRPNAAEVQQALAAIAQGLGQAPEEVPEVEPHTPKNEAGFWNNLAITYGKIGQKEQRLRLQYRALALDETNPGRWFSLGNALDDLKRYDEALKAYDEAESRITPEQVAAHEPIVHSLPNNRGIALRHLRRYPEAIAAYERSLELLPDQADVYFNIANAYGLWVEGDLEQLEGNPLSTALLAQLTERVQKGQQAASEALKLAPHMSQGQQLAGALTALLARIRRLSPSS